MEKHFYILLFVLIIVSCTKIGGEPFRQTNDITFNVSMSDIEEYIRTEKGIVETKADDKISISPMVFGTDTVLYIVNYGKGWEVFSADKRAPRTFAQSDYGRVSETDFTTIPALRILYESFINRILLLKKQSQENTQAIFVDNWNNYHGGELNTRFTNEEVIQQHLLQTKWGQGHPWNIRAPYTSDSLEEHCLTGCGPVAMAQFLYYLNTTEGIQYHPYEDSYTYRYVPNSSYLVLNNTDVTFTSSSQNIWNTMPLDSLSTDLSFAAVSTFMVDLAIATQTKYYENETSTNSNKMFTAFMSKLHMPVIYDTTTSVSFDTLSDLIIQYNKPAIMLIGYINPYYFGHVDPYDYWEYGHFVVADAIKEIYQENQMIGRYVGFNWGWDGYCDNMWLNTDVICWLANNTLYNSVYCMYYIPSID